MSRPAPRLRKQKLDWIAFALFASLVFIGWLMIYSASHIPNQSTSSFLDLGTSVGKQTLFIGIAAVIFLATQLIDWKFWSTFGYVVFAVSILMLVMVLLIGNTVKGSTSWFSLFGFSLQPSEFAKFGTCLALASYLSFHQTTLKEPRHILISISIVALPIGLILLQPDAGSALVFTSFAFLLYRTGLPPLIPLVAVFLGALFIVSLVIDPIYIIPFLIWILSAFFILNFKKKERWIIAGLVLFIGTITGLVLHQPLIPIAANAVFLVITAIAAYGNRMQRQLALLVPGLVICIGISFASNLAFNNFLEPHQQDRINVWLRPGQCDPQGSLYNVLQSKIAIGSGGLQGKGFLNGTMTTLNYVPEQTTDFIFSTIGEEQGFIGTIAIIALFVILLFRILTIAERAKANFIRNYAYGVAGVLFIHFFINIGMTIGLVPIIGIPLPFISYGGSSLLGFTLMIGVLLKMDGARYS
ncbi:MAG: rod shape-determining protein RodA [Eudoraea sp.]|nr:rod shape-determining protein RodA [Eudoraea sp.]